MIYFFVVLLVYLVFDVTLLESRRRNAWRGKERRRPVRVGLGD